MPKKSCIGRGKSACHHPFCGEPIWERHELLFLCQKHAMHVWLTIDMDVAVTHAPDLTPPLTERRPPRPRQPSVVYYLRVGGHIKIGYATELARRMQAYPPTAQLLAVEPGTLATEKALHDRFTVHRIAGREWYQASDELLDHIASVVKQHGQPPDLFAHRQGKAHEQRRPPVQMRRRSGPQGMAV